MSGIIGNETIGTMLLTGMIPRLTGTATTNDVLNGSTFYNTNARSIQTGVLTLIGTATAGDVLNGSTFYNTNAKAIQTGTLALTGNAAVNHVFSGYTFYNTNAKAIQTGTVNVIATNVNKINHAAVAGTLSLMPPAGFYNGTNIYVYIVDSGFAAANIVYTKSIFGIAGTFSYLAAGNYATAGRVESGYSAFVNGTQINGTLALTGTAVAGDVLAGVNFYNTNLFVPVNGTLALTGDATATEVLNGSTFYSTNAKSKLTGTLALDGTAAVGDVLNGSTFYNTNAKSKQTGTLALDGTANAAWVANGYTFYNTNAKSKQTGTMAIMEVAYGAYSSAAANTVLRVAYSNTVNTANTSLAPVATLNAKYKGTYQIACEYSTLNGTANVTAQIEGVNSTNTSGTLLVNVTCNVPPQTFNINMMTDNVTEPALATVTIAINTPVFGVLTLV